MTAASRLQKDVVAGLRAFPLDPGICTERMAASDRAVPAPLLDVEL